MSLASITFDGTDYAVIEATLERSMGGPWVGLLQVDTDVPITGAITVNAPELAIKANVLRGGVFGAQQTIQIVGGAGKLATRLAPRVYRKVKLSLPLSDSVKEAGELLDPTSDPAIANLLLPRFTRMAQSLAGVLDELTRDTGYRWLITDAGQVKLQADSWTKLDITPVVVMEAMSGRRVILACEDAILRPGHELSGRRITTVIHRFSDTFRTEAWY